MVQVIPLHSEFLSESEIGDLEFSDTGRDPRFMHGRWLGVVFVALMLSTSVGLLVLSALGEATMLNQIVAGAFAWLFGVGTLASFVLFVGRR